MRMIYHMPDFLCTCADAYKYGCMHLLEWPVVQNFFLHLFKKISYIHLEEKN